MPTMPARKTKCAMPFCGICQPEGATVAAVTLSNNLNPDKSNHIINSIINNFHLKTAATVCASTLMIASSTKQHNLLR
jgi:hypothetical protein